MEVVVVVVVVQIKLYTILPSTKISAHSLIFTFTFTFTSTYYYYHSIRTIPIAKRRYYGRVQAAVHEFLLLGPEVVKADFSAPTIQAFFDINGKK